MKQTNKTSAVLLGAGLILLLVFTFAGRAAAQTAPTLASVNFFGGSGDQGGAHWARGTRIDINNGNILLTGTILPIKGNGGNAAIVVKYAAPTTSTSSPVWSGTWPLGNLFGVTSTNNAMYAGGWSHPSSGLTIDNVGGQEVKSVLVKFPTNGFTGAGPGGSTWVATPNLRLPNSSGFFSFAGWEEHIGLTTAVEGGNTFIYAIGGGQPCSHFGQIIAKYDTLGNLVAAAPDTAAGHVFNSCSFPAASSSNGAEITILNGNNYSVGVAETSVDGAAPTIWKRDPNLNLIWRKRDASLSGDFLGVTASGGALYAVGVTRGTPQNYIIQKYDEAGNQLWSTVSSGAGDDLLLGIVEVGGRLFAVGHTNSQGAGGTDVIILEVDPNNGAILSQTLFGDAQDDRAFDAATDGTDLYVVGDSRSFASADGNVVGQSDLMLLRYTLGPSAPSLANITLDITKAKVKLGKKAGKDKFEVKGSLTLDADSDGIDILNEDVTVTLDGFSETIPAGSFFQKHNKFKFHSGSASGIKEIEIRSDGRFKVEAKRLDLGAIDFSAPVPFSLQIGNDLGETDLLLDHKGKLSEPEDDDEDEHEDEHEDDGDDD
ncbi:MAG: hypothetical protein ACE5G9_08495 [Nitrospinales bacterium]